MRRIAVFLIALTALPAAAGVVVDPPFADRLYPYTLPGGVFIGTPAARAGAALPAVVVACRRDESSAVLAEAATLAFFLGNRADDGGSSLLPSAPGGLVVFQDEWSPSPGAGAIVVGDGPVARAWGVAFDGPSVFRRASDGTDLLFVGGRNEEETIEALRYLGRMRLAFQGGAYATFFNFVRLRAFLERENWDAAADLIESPDGVAACGRNLALAAPMMSAFPARSKEIATRRNAILFLEMPAAVAGRDGTRAKALWAEAMESCYACHQGTGGAPRLRKFAPAETAHAPHQKIAARLLPETSCEFCHHGPTSVVGYE